jgi:hypothetical protein
MVSRILHPLYDLRLVGLPGIGEFLDALIGRVHDR